MNHDKSKGLMIPKEIYAMEDISPTDKMVLSEIHWFSQSGPGYWGSNRSLADSLKVGEATIKRSIAKLLESKYLHKKILNDDTMKGRLLFSSMVCTKGQSDPVEGQNDPHRVNLSEPRVNLIPEQGQSDPRAGSNRSTNNTVNNTRKIHKYTSDENLQEEDTKRDQYITRTVSQFMPSMRKKYKGRMSESHFEKMAHSLTRILIRRAEDEKKKDISEVFLMNEMTSLSRNLKAYEVVFILEKAASESWLTASGMIERVKETFKKDLAFEDREGKRFEQEYEMKLMRQEQV